MRKPQRWARLWPTLHPRYQASFQFQWLRVIERPNPDVPPMAGYIWLDLAGKAHLVEAKDFEIVERDKARILVVDDEVSIRQALHAALTKAGYEVLQARDGDEALRLWRDKGPDLVITDIHMPNKSGLVLMHELQESRTSSRVIAMTDGGPTRNPSLLGVAELLGAVRKIGKPFAMETMMAAVQEELSTEG